jgi:hypothetical protein
MEDLTNLRQFSLELCETKVSDKFLQALLKPLSNLVYLQELSLGFGKTQLKLDETIINLASVLEKLTKLTKLSVVLYRTELKDAGIT